MGSLPDPKRLPPAPASSASQCASSSRNDASSSSAPDDHIFHLRDSNGFSIIAMNGAGAKLRTDCMDREEVASQIIAALATARREPVEAALELSENRFGQEMSRAEEARLVRKFDLHILPIIILLYLCCFMDRINIVPILSIGWGATSSFIGLVRTKKEFYILRLLLGLFEAGYFATVCLYFTFFYRRRELGTRICYLFATTAFAGSIAGLLGYAIGSLDHRGGLQAWRWLLIIEGIPSILLGCIAYPLLANTPEEAKYLTEKEKALLVVRRQLDGTNLGVADSRGIIQWDQCFAAWKDWKVLVMAVAQVGVASMLYSYSSFLPTIIHGMGFGPVTSQLLSIPCYFFGALVYLLCAYFSDRIGHRGTFVVGACMYIGCLVVAGGLFVSVGMPISWAANNLPSHYKRAAGQGTIQMVGNLAGIYSPFLYLPQYGPRFIVGHSVTVGCIFYAAILFAFVSYKLRQENYLRARGGRDYLFEGRSAEEINKLGDRHPWYRYID
ncbi:Major facilitator superfamily transporter [Apiospora saccharicola]|uniref:Major facilitator superfamily transporter n=1 Tax=Apiospora saccharicola TaxID=335842 RepID=A0ABR1URD8_9PEZI